MIWAYTLISVLIISIISLVGIFTLGIKIKTLQKILHFFVAFSAGALLGDTFLHLLPEANEKNPSSTVAIAIIIGVLFFFALEKILRWRHCHEEGCEDHPKHLGYMNFVGDGLHNFIDGVLIGASFMASIPIGIATTTAVILHEIPQELGDFGVLLHSGFSKGKALWLNFLSATLAIIGALLILIIGNVAISFTNFIVPVAAGGFLYIALSDLIPELHKETKWQNAISQIFFIALGVGIMYLLLFLE